MKLGSSEEVRGEDGPACCAFAVELCACASEEEVEEVAGGSAVFLRL